MSDALTKLKAKGKDYEIKDDVLNKLDGIKGEWDKQSKNSGIKDAGKVIETTISALDDMQSGRPTDIIRGGLNIIGSVATLVGGPFGAAAGAVCGVLGAILAADSKPKPNMATVFAGKVRVELEKFKQEERQAELTGLETLMKRMHAALKLLDPLMPDQSKNTELKNLTLVDEFVKFIGKVSADIKKPFTDKEGIDVCVNAMVVYCHAQMSFMLLLANIILTYKATGREIKFVKKQLEGQIKDAKDQLGFLSNEKYLCDAGLLPLEGGAGGNGGKMLKISHLKWKLQESAIVDEFRKNLNMSPMPTRSTIDTRFAKAERFKAEYKVKGVYYTEPEKEKNEHFFQLINDTCFPIKVVCGKAGDHINGLDFKKDMQPFSSYEHVASNFTRFFSAGGYFIIYFDKKMRSFEKPFDFNAPNGKVFELALSNPSVGCKKLAFLEKDDVQKITGDDAWNKLENGFPPNIFFSHGGKHYVLGGHVTDPPSLLPKIELDGKENPRLDGLVNQVADISKKAVGYYLDLAVPMFLVPRKLRPAESLYDKNVDRTWRFIVQEVDSSIIPPK